MNSVNFTFSCNKIRVCPKSSFSYSRTTRIIFYTMVAVVSYFIMYALLYESLSPNPDIELVKIISGFTGVVVSIIVYNVIIVSELLIRGEHERFHR